MTNVQIQITIPNDIIECELITFYDHPTSPLQALRVEDDGSGEVRSIQWTNALLAGRTVLVRDYEEDGEGGETFEVTLDHLAEGFRALAQRNPSRLARMLRGQSDCFDSTSLMQLVCLGEVKYG